MGEGGVEVRDVFAAALSQVGSAAAAAVEHRSRFAHQHAHIAGGVGGASEDETRGVAIT